MEFPKTVVILGGGTGGVAAAHRLRKGLPASCRIILIDREEFHYFAPSFLWLMIGRRTVEQIRRPLKSLVKKGIEFVCEEVQSIDPETRTVRTTKQEIKADILIISLGCAYNPKAIPGLSESGETFYTLEGSQAIGEKLQAFEKGNIAIVTASPQYKCPAAPYEASMLVDDYCRKKGIRQNVKIDFYAAEGAPMATGGPAVSGAVLSLLEKKEIHYHPGHQVECIDSEKQEIKFTDSSSAPFDMLLYVPPHTAPKVIQESVLASEKGWIPVDSRTLETKFKDVYAIGDVTAIQLKIGKPFPKAGVFAHGEAEVIAHNIIQKSKKKQSTRLYAGKGFCFVEAGNGLAGIGIGYFYEDVPKMTMHAPNLFWHLGKVLFEKYWFWKYF